MSQSTFTVGYGSKIYMAPISGGAVGTYVAVAQSKDLNGPEPEVGKINITNNDSANNTKESAPGMIDPGSLDFELVYAKAQATLLYATVGDGNTYGWKEVYADGSAWTFTGWISKFGTESKTEDEALMNKVTLTLATKPAYLPNGS